LSRFNIEGDSATTCATFVVGKYVSDF